MKIRSKIVVVVACLAQAFSGFAAVSIADDWPQWMGPDRDGTYEEAGLVDSIPAAGLPIHWRVPIHGGYAGPAVHDGRVFVADYRRTAGEFIETPGDRPKLEGFERLLCLDAATGEKIWEHEYSCDYEISYPAGPRATPTVANGLVVMLGAQGDLTVLNEKDGTVKWHVNLPTRFGANVPIWGFSAHPFVHDNMVVTMVGGEGQAVVAFDLATGEVKWKALSSDDAGYCPVSLIHAGGVDQLLVWHPTAVASLNPSTGATYWTVPHVPDYGMSISQPQRDGDLLFVSGIKNKSIMLKLASEKPAITEVWASTPKTSMSVSTMTPMLHDGMIYGTDEGLGALIGARASDGERLWQSYDPVNPQNTRRLAAGTAFVTRHEPSGRYWLFGEAGVLTLAELSAKGYQSLGQMFVLEPTQSAFGRKVIWTHPAYANRTAYVRNDKELVAIDLEKK